MQIASKECAKCAQVKDLSNFGLNSRYKDGHQSYCKECMYEYDKSRRERLHPKEDKPQAQEGYKVCNKCKTEKPLDQFHKSKSSKDGHKGECKECMCARSREYQQNNSDKVKEKKQAYRASEKGKQVQQEYAKKRYQENI